MAAIWDATVGLEECWPTIKELKQKTQGARAGDAQHLCALCGGIICGIIVEASTGDSLHYGCACILHVSTFAHMAALAERRHRKRLRRRAHFERWDLVRARKRKPVRTSSRPLGTPDCSRTDGASPHRAIYQSAPCDLQGVSPQRCGHAEGEAACGAAVRVPPPDSPPLARDNGSGSDTLRSSPCPCGRRVLS